MPADRELYLQKHNNAHRSLNILLSSFLAAPAWFALRFQDLSLFLIPENRPIAIVIALMLSGVYILLVLGFHYKCVEYEALLGGQLVPGNPSGTVHASP